MENLHQIALKIVSDGKGILAADESTGTMTQRFDKINVESNPINRLKFREILFSSSAMKEFIGGVILFDETIKQTTSSGQRKAAAAPSDPSRSRRAALPRSPPVVADAASSAGEPSGRKSSCS